MKKRMFLVPIASLFLSFITLLPADVGFAQIDTTLREFFPTHIGDLWEYEEYNPPFSFRYQIRLTGDTLMPNGRRYHKFSGTEGGFYRIDDSMRVYKHTTTYSACSDSEYLIYDLAIREEGIWRTCLPGRDSLSRFIGLYGTVRNHPLPRLSVVRDVKQYCDAMIQRQTGDTDFCNLVPGVLFAPRRLAKGFGLVWTQFEGPPEVLDGAIIDGVRYGTVTSVDDLPDAQRGNRPTGPRLEQNFPNPFNPTTNIKFQLPEDGIVSLIVYNTLGQEVATLVNQSRTAGSYTETSDASQLASGVYIYTLKAGNFTALKKLSLMK